METSTYLSQKLHTPQLLSLLAVGVREALARTVLGITKPARQSAVVAGILFGSLVGLRSKNEGLDQSLVGEEDLGLLNTMRGAS